MSEYQQYQEAAVDDGEDFDEQEELEEEDTWECGQWDTMDFLFSTSVFFFAREGKGEECGYSKLYIYLERDLSLTDRAKIEVKHDGHAMDSSITWHVNMRVAYLSPDMDASS